MKPVAQTHLAPPEGNCMAACLASILEVDIDAMPNYHGEDWWERWNEWLLGFYGVSLYWVAPDPAGTPLTPYIAIGPSPRGDYNHAVVMLGGDVLHDPHPEGGFDPAGVVEWDLLLFARPEAPREAS